MLVVEVVQPTEAEMDAIVSAMIRAAMARWGQWFHEGSDQIPATIAALRTVHPRAARRIIDLAVGFAVSAGRRFVLAEDVEHARKITMSLRSAMKFGFL
jgi:histone H3/H4